MDKKFIFQPVQKHLNPTLENLSGTLDWTFIKCESNGVRVSWFFTMIFFKGSNLKFVRISVFPKTSNKSHENLSKGLEWVFCQVYVLSHKTKLVLYNVALS